MSGGQSNAHTTKCLETTERIAEKLYPKTGMESYNTTCFASRAATIDRSG